MSAAAPTSLRADVLLSLRNACKLGASLTGTWAIALGVRVFLPRYLGPDTFGAFQFADAFAITALMITNLGVDTYVRAEIATRPGYVNDFLGGLLLLRVALGAVVIAAVLGALAAAGKPAPVLQLVFALGVAQVLSHINGTYAAALHAVGLVDGLSLLNVGSKLTWAAGVAAVFAAGVGARGVAVAVVASELLRTVGLAWLTRRHIAGRVGWRLRPALAVVRASLPFLVSALAQTAYARIDVSIMSFLAADREVGWYGAASTVAGLALLLAPLISWVLLPLTARAAQRSHDELLLVARRAMELILTLACPVMLLLALGADAIVSLAFGSAYAPAAGSLRLLAPTFVLTYATMVAATVLIRMNRAWAITWTSVGGMVLASALNLWLIPRTLAEFGPGGAGYAAAVSLVVTEIATLGVLARLVGAPLLDRRTVTLLGKIAVVSAVVVVVDRTLLGAGLWRLVADACVYAGLGLVSGALDLRAATRWVRGSRGPRLVAAEAGV